MTGGVRQNTRISAETYDSETEPSAAGKFQNYFSETYFYPNISVPFPSNGHFGTILSRAVSGIFFFIRLAAQQEMFVICFNA